MPGIPELKAAGWLAPSATSPGDEHPRYLMFARLEHQMDAPHGWTVELHECERPGRKVKRWYPTEDEACAATGALYQLGKVIGAWRWHTYPRDLAPPSRPSPGFLRTRARRR